MEPAEMFTKQLNCGWVGVDEVLSGFELEIHRLEMEKERLLKLIDRVRMTRMGMKMRRRELGWDWDREK